MASDQFISFLFGFMSIPTSYADRHEFTIIYEKNFSHLNYLLKLPTKNDFNIFIYKIHKNSWKVTYVWQWYSHILVLSYLFFFTSLSLQLSVMLCHNFYFIAHFLCLSLSLMLFSFFSSKVLFKQTPSYHKSTYMNIIRDLMLWEKKEILSMKWQEKLQEKIYKSFTNLSSFLCYKKHNFYMWIFYVGFLKFHFKSLP